MTRNIATVLIAVAVTATTAFAQRTIPGDINLSAAPKTEADMLAVLGSDAPPAEKAAACKLLAIHGSGAAAPELAKLLSEPQLASWARIALEAIPDPACDEALREAAAELDGELLVGVINSIGVRRDAEALEVLAKRLVDADAGVASAAAVALGHIDHVDAIKALQPALTVEDPDVRSAVAEGLILCAEQRVDGNDVVAAIAIYNAVRAADVPAQRVREATRGVILAHGDSGIPLLLEQLESPDKRMFQMALSTAREFPGAKVDAQLATVLNSAAPERGALIVQAMADRTETVSVPAVLKAATAGHPQVRAAALAALARVGDESCLAILLDVAAGDDPQLAGLARQTLAELSGDKVDSRVLDLLSSADGGRYVVLIEVVGKRRIEATQLLLPALDHADAEVRQTALAALGETIALDKLPVLIDRVVNPVDPQDEVAASRALKVASIRMPDREACAAELAAAIEQSSTTATKIALLDILGEMGGTQALSAVAAAGNSDDAELQNAATRLLGKWMTADAAPVLLGIARQSPAHKYQIRALRGYIRIVRQFDLPEQERSKMCRHAFEAADRADEQRMVLEVLQRYPNAANLELAAEAMKVPELHDAATSAHEAIERELN